MWPASTAPPPPTPIVSGGQPQLAERGLDPTVTASGSADGLWVVVAGYQYETSSDGGTTWTTSTAGASVTVSIRGRRRWCGSARIDNSGNVSGWVGDTVRHRPYAAVGSVGQRRQPGLAERGLDHDRLPPAPSDALSGVAGYEFETSLSRRRHLVGGGRRRPR